MTLDALVSFMENYRDITVDGTSKYLRYSHYSRGNEQCYIFSNEDVTSTSVVLQLREFTGGEYVLWDAFENKIVRRQSIDGRIPLTIAPNNLLVLLTGTDLAANCDAFLWESNDAPTELTPEWKIELCQENKLPDYKLYKTTTTLKSITDADELPDFTGNMRYTATVALDAKKHQVLDLGIVGQCAEVRLNGKIVGTRIFAPYRFDISDAVQDGNNLLEITVANTCVYEQQDRFSRFMLIKPSGLLGPVKV